MDRFIGYATDKYKDVLDNLKSSLDRFIENPDDVKTILDATFKIQFG